MSDQTATHKILPLLSKSSSQAEQKWQWNGLSLCHIFELRGRKNPVQCCTVVLQIFFTKIWALLLFFLTPNPSSSGNISIFPFVTWLCKYMIFLNICFPILNTKILSFAVKRFALGIVKLDHVMKNVCQLGSFLQPFFIFQGLSKVCPTIFLKVFL